MTVEQFKQRLMGFIMVLFSIMMIKIAVSNNIADSTLVGVFLAIGLCGIWCMIEKFGK